MAGTDGTDPRMGLRRSVTTIARQLLNENYNLSHVFFFHNRSVNVLFSGIISLPHFSFSM